MSRLSDLLNPAPSPRSSTPRPINVNVSAAEAGHGRNASITSPLEALAIAATDSPSIASFLQPTSGPLTRPAVTEHSQQPSAIVDAPDSQQPTGSTVKQEPGVVTQPSEPLMASPEEPPVAGPSDTPKPVADRQSPKVEGMKRDESEKPPTPNLLTQVKREPTDTNPPTPALQSPTVLPTTEGKKRPAPKNKKGTASVIKKPAAKKRKVESHSKDGTPFSQRSGTPNSSRASKTPASKNRKRNSATPAQSSPQRSIEGDDDGDDDDDDGELFCICRRPDDHKWMIGCDGGCDDWFHGKCVNMKEEDAELIDKYICPNCTDKGVGVTTWKPMCRLDGCRVPARVAGPRPSKYCSNEHGEEFMRRKVEAKEADSKFALKKKRPPESADTLQNPEDSPVEQGENQAYLRGGYLRASEVKSLVAASKDVTEFRRLGESVLVSNPLESNQDDKMAVDGESGIQSTEEERPRLEEIKAKQAGLKHRLESLKAKEKLLSLVRSRAQETLSLLNKRPPPEGKKKETIKDICGFDSRLSWSDIEFDEWCQSGEGSKTLESGVLGAPKMDKALVDGEGDTAMSNGPDSDANDIGRGVCQKKRCDRHKAWFKLHQQEIASERGICHHELQRLDREAKGIGERAILKRLEADGMVEENAEGQAGHTEPQTES